MFLSGSTKGNEKGMSSGAFRAFQESRADEERWELVDGVPVMIAPPKIGHQKIAGNLDRLLNAALAMHDPSRMAVQRPGLELGFDSTVLVGVGRGSQFVPEPDVAVIEDEPDPDPDQRTVKAAYLLAEIVSSTDETPRTRGADPGSQ